MNRFFFNTTVGPVPKYNRKLSKRGKIDTLAHIYMTSHLWLGADTSIKSGEVN
jgi:hypothetical protein